MNKTENKNISLMPRRVYKDNDPLNPKNVNYTYECKNQNKGIPLMKRNNLTKKQIHSIK